MKDGKLKSIVRFAYPQNSEFVSCFYQNEVVGEIGDLGCGFLFYGNNSNLPVQASSEIDREVIRIRRSMV